MVPWGNLLVVGLFFVFCSALSLGVYITANFRGGLKVHLLHTICTFLGLWSLGLVLVRVAPSYREALFWQRVSALGWTTVYSLLLHFVLVLTENRFLRKWWLYFLVYLPAFLNLLVFSLLPGFVETTQELVKSSSGWVVLPAFCFWNWFFYLYCLSFVVLSGVLLFRWSKKLYNADQRKKANLVVFSLFFSAALGVFLGLVLSLRRVVEFSNPEPIIALFPVTLLAIFLRTQVEFLGIKRRSFSERVAQGEVLSEKGKVLLYTHLAGAHILGSFLYVVVSSFLLGHPPGLQDFLWATSFFLIGVGIYYLCAWEGSEKWRDFGFGMALSLSAFFVFLRVALLVGERPFLVLFFVFFLLPTILLGDFRAFATVAAIISLIQALIWFKIFPEVLSSPIHLLMQFVATIFTVSFVLVVFCIRNVYLKRLAENLDQLNVQRAVAYLSSQLIDVTSSTLEEGLKLILCKLLKNYKMQCAYFLVFTGESNLRCLAHQGSEVSDSACNSFQEFQKELLTVCEEIARSGEPFVLEDISSLSPEKKQSVRCFEKAGMRSVIVIPVEGDERLHGVLILGAPYGKIFSSYQRESLKVLSNLLSNVLERVEAEQKLQQMAFYDPLTGLPNRRLFMDRLSKVLQLAKRTGKLVAVVFVDLDSFKTINDSEGHRVGDELLRQVAQRFSKCVREYDTVARFGGDEFLILLSNLSGSEEIVGVVERVLRGFQEPFFVQGQELFIAASCGISIYPLDGEGSEELIRAADLAMYAAKIEGGGTYAFCSRQLKEKARKKQLLLSGLYKALDKKELFVYYQPQVDSSAGNIVGVEALLRWRHPELGLLLPGSFIHLAEQTGLIVPIGEWVLRTACSQLAAWQKKGARISRVAVNLSAVQLRDPRLVEKVRRAVEEAGIFPDNLELEVTESAIFQRTDEVIELLGKLKELGVRIALDDFGVGYSSLIRLKMLPVDRVKVDRRFFRSIPCERRDMAIVENIIQLARSINAAVIAEGIENKQQLEFVVDRGCYEIQGYYYYHPLPPEEMETLLLGAEGKKG